MNNLSITIRRLVGLLIMAILLTTSCKVEKIEQDLADPVFSLRSTNDCELFFKGTTFNANTCEIIPNAEIEISDLGIKTSSDELGEFCVEINVSPDEYAFFEGGKIVKVSKDNHVTNTLNIVFSDYYNPDDCGDIKTTFIDLDVLLTQRNAPVLVTDAVGDWIVTESYSIKKGYEEAGMKECDYLFWISENSVDSDTEVSFTPLHINQTHGTIDVPQGIIARFEIYPTNAICGVPIMVKFQPCRDDVPNLELLEHYRFNASTNVWEKSETNDFSIDSEGEVMLNIDCLGEHLIAYQPSIIIESDIIRYNGLASQTLENCNCNEPMVFTKDYTFDNRVDETFTIEAERTELASRILVSDIRNSLNIPTFAAEKRFDYNINRGEDKTAIQVIHERNFTLAGTVDKCSIKEFFAREQYRDISGTINGVPFKYSTIVALDIGERTDKCPTSSACHQGCSG